MTAAEARKKQWESLTDKPLKDKLKYIFIYYWAAILGCVCVIAFAVSWISSALQQKDTALSGYLLNSISQQSYEGNLAEEFMVHQGIDPEVNDVLLTANTSYSSQVTSDTGIYVLESIVVRAASGELDFIVADLETYPVLSAYFVDLRTVMTAEQLEKWKSCFVYVEQSALDKLTSGELDQVELPEYHLSDEGLENPMPIGIRLPETCRLFEAYAFPNGDVIFGITRAASNISNTLAFLEYIFS